MNDLMDDRIDEAGEALNTLADGPARRASEAIDAAFQRTGANIEAAFSRAAQNGEVSFSRLTDSILRDLARLAAERFIERPLQGAIDQLLSGLPFFGARAEGGPVNAGGAYLVGEKGPELFVPSGHGAVEPTAGRSITVNIQIAPGTDPAGLEQSEDRIARSLTRAVQRGSRYL